MKALIIIDMQNSFLPSGSLAVYDGDKILPAINFVQEAFDVVVATQDWHPINHISFAQNHEGKNLFDVITLEDDTQQVLWPTHCVQGTPGAELSKYLHTNKINMIIRKGMDPKVDSYSCFFDNNKKNDTGLNGYLKGLGITDVYVCGLAADYCVYFSILDAISLGYNTHLITDATKAVSNEDFTLNKKPVLKNMGCKFVISDNLWDKKN